MSAARRRLRIGFLMDPLAGIDIDADTTFAFMLEAQSRGHEVLFLESRGLAIRRGVPEARLRAVELRRRRGDHFRLGEERTEALEALDVLFLRRDPPFDLEFFFDTHVVSLVDQQRTLILNSPRGLREANEKLYALHFPEITPESLVTSDMDLLRAFLRELDGEMIIKPLDGCGGAGIFHLRAGDRNLNSILEFATDHGRRRLMAQRYLPEVRAGDKRIILLDGEPKGAVLRVPDDLESRSNFHVGGAPARADLTERDREICATVAPRLARDGLVFVGLDVIGGYLTEINVTSPTGVQEIDRLDGIRIEADVIDWVERHAPESDRGPAAR